MKSDTTTILVSRKNWMYITNMVIDLRLQNKDEALSMLISEFDKQGGTDAKKKGK